MESQSPETETIQPVVFRGKKRKAFRQRTVAEVDDESTVKEAATATGSAPKIDAVADALLPPPHATIPESAAGATQSPPSASEGARNERSHEGDGKDDGEGATTSALSEALLRLRNARKNRLRGGVVFGVDNNNNPQNHSTGADDELSLMIREEEKKVVDQSTLAVATANKRFAPQTGLSGEVVNRHMEEYIEAELAKRHAMAYGGGGSGGGGSQQQQQQQQQQQSSLSRGGEVPTKGDKHTALTGKLFEVDLGDEIRNRNARLTDRAMRKLQGLAVDEDDDEDELDPDRQPGQGGRPGKKVRLGRDGKPWRPRNQRDEDAIKRDQIVEDILRETRLDAYKTPTLPPDSTTGAGTGAGGEEDEDEGAADDRIAEQFRREFLDALAERHRRRRRAPAQHASKAGPKKEEEGLRGPKLGGSRNTRAAYREKILKEREAKKK